MPMRQAPGHFFEQQSRLGHQRGLLAQGVPRQGSRQTAAAGEHGGMEHALADIADRTIEIKRSRELP